jgi:hypothetical protein
MPSDPDPWLTASSAGGATVGAMQTRPVVPDYGGACVSNLVPALLAHRDAGRGWIPDEVLDARQVVVFVIDGLGARQLAERAAVAPTLTSLTVRSIDSVAPTTTATALTSITTGTTPGEHGVIGYKIRVGGEILNTLRWSSEQGDARARIDPSELQPIGPFAGARPPVISQAQFADSGFTAAHLRDGVYRPYWLASSIPVDVRRALDEGSPFVYAYYDGIDKVAHICGFGPHYDAELAFVDRLVADIAAALPPGGALVVTADHGQVQVGDAIVALGPQTCALTSAVSGEARFVWLHASSGRTDALAEAAAAEHGDVAWVVSAEQVLDEGWFGRMVTNDAAGRLGDVALVAREAVALVHPGRPGPKLQTRHGSLTPDEIEVPLAVALG